jgi:hypothetical protein
MESFKEKSKKSILVVSIIAFCLLMVVIIYFRNEILGYFETDSSNIITILLNAVFGLVVSITPFLIAIYIREKLIAKREHTKKKIESYEKLIEFVKKYVEIKKFEESVKVLPMEYLRQIHPEYIKQKDDLRVLKNDLRRILIVWGSEDVLDMYNKYSLLENPTEKETLEFLKFIRKEIGHKDVYIEDQVLIDLFRKN